jgi:ribosomal protein S18 acetylase RimI-like enzyme
VTPARPARHIEVSGPHDGCADLCAPILRALPAWFGIEEATAAYIRATEELPTFLATPKDQQDGCSGFLTLKHHTDAAAEIYVMGVRPEAHRRGVGRALVTAAENYLRSLGIAYLQVKTLSSAHPDENYAKTRRFYQAMGFSPLEELPELWGPANPCLLMVKYLGADNTEGEMNDEQPSSRRE